MAQNIPALVKTPYKKMSYTPKQAMEFAKCLDPITGPHYFLSNFFHIQHPVRGKIVYKPYLYQDKLIDVYHNYRFSVNMLSRQMGKSVTAAGYLLWYAMFKSDSTILVAANKHSSAQEIMNRIRFAYECCPDHIRAGATSYNKGSVEFDNGSRIVSQATSATTGRGMSISLLYSDELAFVPPNIAAEFWTSISPTLATGGKAIITSTPNSDEDQFWNIWTEANKCIDEYGNTTDIGKNGFKAYSALWHEHPDRDDKWAAEERGRIGDERFEREHNLRPIIFEETLINPMKLSQLEGKEPIEKQGQVRWYEKPKKGAMYAVALDPSLGTGGDNAAIQVVQLPEFVQIAEWQHNKTPIKNQVYILREIVNYLSEESGSNTNVYYTVENNGIGEAAILAISELDEASFNGVFISEPKKVGHSRAYRKGFNTTNKPKVTAALKLKELIEHGIFKIHSKNLLSELKTYVAVGNTFNGRPGETDDLVSACLLVVRLAAVLKDYDPTLDERMKGESDYYIEPMPFIMVSSY